MPKIPMIRVNESHRPTACRTPVHPERWATRLGVILAVAGSAVGLGNFLRFPASLPRTAAAPS